MDSNGGLNGVFLRGVASRFISVPSIAPLKYAIFLTIGALKFPEMSLPQNAQPLNALPPQKKHYAREENISCTG